MAESMIEQIRRHQKTLRWLLLGADVLTFLMASTCGVDLATWFRSADQIDPAWLWAYPTSIVFGLSAVVYLQVVRAKVARVYREGHVLLARLRAAGPAPGERLV